MLSFAKFKTMPIPKPTTSENEEEYIERCMSDPIMLEEYPTERQRYAVCIMTFEMSNSYTNQDSYTDYPQAASDNAKKVLDWRDEHGDEVQGMTRVGWTRANQLAKREPISFDTVKRMAAFIRHEKNAEISEENKGKPWKDAGYVAWLGWGGTEGVNWAIRKVDQIEKQKEK